MGPQGQRRNVKSRRIVKWPAESRPDRDGAGVRVGVANTNVRRRKDASLAYQERCIKGKAFKNLPTAFPAR